MSTSVSSGSSSVLGNTIVASTDSQANEEKYQIRPTYKNMFKPQEVKRVLDDVLQSQLANRVYDQNETGTWTKEIATLIKAQLKELKLPRYKFLVQVIIGEMKGAGVRCGCRCLWDQQTDKVAEAQFTNVQQYHTTQNKRIEIRTREQMYDQIEGRRENATRSKEGSIPHHMSSPISSHCFLLF